MGYRVEWTDPRTGKRTGVTVFSETARDTLMRAWTGYDERTAKLAFPPKYTASPTVENTED